MAEHEARIEIPGHGNLEIRPAAGEVVYCPDVGREEYFADHPLLNEPGALRWAIAGHAGRALIGRVRSASLHLFDAKHSRFRSLATGERLARVEQLAIVNTGDLFIAVTENGILAIDTGRRSGDEDEEGCERWRINQTTYNWSYIGRDDATLFFSDANENLLAFDSDSGREASL